MTPSAYLDPASRRRQSRILLLKVAFLVGYLDLAFYVVPRDFFEYKFAQFLFNYAHGLARRSLEGEVFRHLFSPPYPIELFGRLAGFQTIAVFVLFAAIVWRVDRRSRASSRFILALLVASSPTTFKNLIFDTGRQDGIGVLAIEVSILLGLAPSGYPLALFLCAALLPMALVNENLLLLYAPACLAIHGCRLWAERKERPARGLPAVLKVAPFVILAASYVVCLRLPYPKIPRAEYHRYLQGLTPQNLDQCEPERWLYSNASDNFAFARGEWARLSPLQFASAGQYAAFLLVLVLVCALVALSTDRDSPRNRRLFAAGLALIAPGYLVLFAGASDLARWFSNMNVAVMLFGLWYLSWSGGEKWPRLWWVLVPIAAFQLTMIGGFGIVYPNFTLAGDWARLAALF